MSALVAERQLTWWQGVGSPGLGGYVLAFLVSAGVMGLSVPMEATVGHFVHGSWSLDDLFYATAVGVLTAIFALFYGLPGALVGCLLVHLVCRRIPEQSIHVATAGLAGAAAGVVYDAVLFDEFWGMLWILLGIAAAIGRAVVIPLARRRQS